MKLVDVAIFNFPNEAGVLESILSSENIRYFLNNQDIVTIVPGSGITLSVEESDKERVIQIINEAGFGKYLIKESEAS